MKTRIKILLAVLLAVITVFCFAACGASAGGDNAGGNAGNVTVGDNENTGGGENSSGANSGESNGSENNGGANSGESNGSENNGGANSGGDGKGVLVAYFSATGNTEPVARYAASYTGAALYEIVPAVPYTSADLNYGDSNSRTSKENRDGNARPEISGGVENMSGYDVVFIGYPIWHGKAPKIIYTFLESYDFSGKTIVPFCTSASSPLGSSASELHSLASGADWKAGRRFAIGTGEAAVQTWIDGLGLDIKSEANMIKVHCGNNVLDIELEDNPSAKAFAEKLKSGDVTVGMDDYGDFEKVGSLGFSIVRTDERITTAPGDVILYLGSSITIYYDTNSYTFTRLGRIKNMTRESMLAFFGGAGEVTVTFSLK